MIKNLAGQGKSAYDDSGAPYVVTVPNYDRGAVLALLLVIFAAIMILVGGKKGAMALLGLVYTVASIWYLVIPLILRGGSGFARL